MKYLILDYRDEPPPQYQPSPGYGYPPQYPPQQYTDHPGFPPGGYSTNAVIVSIFSIMILTQSLIFLILKLYSIFYVEANILCF